MKVKTTNTDVLILEPEVFGDERGYFFESYNHKTFSKSACIKTDFVQDNHSHSVYHVLRGLHYQLKKPQGKLVRVVTGEVYDVAVDLRESSATFGKWTGVHLSAAVHQEVWVPPGFAHGFLVLSETADFLYKTTDYYDAKDEFCLMWDDPFVGVEWPLKTRPLLSPKDAEGKSFTNLPYFP